MKNSKGFTLLELLVATAIFAVVIAAAYSLFDASRRLASRAEFSAQMYQSARAALQTIEADLRGAVMLGTAFDTGFIGATSGTEKEPLDKLELITVSRYTAASHDVNETDVVRGADLSKVYYWIEADLTKKAHGLVRERPLELTPPSGPAHRDEDVVEIAQDVVFINFRYYDGSDWLDQWDSTQTHKLPKAVEVTVFVRGEWRDEEVLQPFTTRVYLAVGADTPEKAQ